MHMSSRVALVDPRGWQGAVQGNRPFPNVGIAYLVASLRTRGHEVFVIDLNNSTMVDQDVLLSVLEFQPDLIGISAKTATIRDSRNLAKQMKVAMPSVPIVVGGPHAVVCWQALAQEEWFDAVFVGEAEEGLPEICRFIKEKEPLETIRGVVTKLNKEHKEFDCPLNADLDSLPFPDYHLFPDKVRKALRIGYPLLTSRGCVYRCAYCSVPVISGQSFRARSPSNILDELEWAKREYGITKFEIIDDLFNFDIERCKVLCQMLLDEKIALEWSCPNGLRADRVDKELAQLMHASGCRSVMVGVESAGAAILARVNKGESIGDIEKGIRTFQQAEIAVGGFFIIGLPGDSLEAVRKSAQFARRLKIGALFNMFVPYPGTRLWEWAKNHARFLCDIERGLHFADTPDRARPVIETDDFPAKKRQRAYEMAHTLVENFSAIISAKTPRWLFILKAFTLLAKYAPYLIPLVFWKMVTRHEL